MVVRMDTTSPLSPDCRVADPTEHKNTFDRPRRQAVSSDAELSAA